MTLLGIALGIQQTFDVVRPSGRCIVGIAAPGGRDTDPIEKIVPGHSQEWLFFAFSLGMSQPAGYGRAGGLAGAGNSGGFFRTTSADGVQGVGLGLSIVQVWAERMGGAPQLSVVQFQGLC